MTVALLREKKKVFKAFESGMLSLHTDNYSAYR